MSEQIIDACCLINVYASGKNESILRTCGKLWIPEQVREESLSIRRVDEDDPSKLVPEEIALEQAIAEGYLELCDLEGTQEFSSYVNFATQLGDGEAACLAIALSRGWTVATDDRKARRIAGELGISLVSTPELVNRWVQATSPAEELVVEVLKNIERFARFRPRKADSLHGWWMDLTDESK